MNQIIPHSRPTVGAEEAEALRQVVLSGHLAQGREVEAFEEEMAAFAGRRFGVAVSSGTAGLHLALLALGVEAGNAVVIPSYVCTALLHAVWGAGARPVLGDIDRRTRNLDAGDVARRNCTAGRAIIVPHMFGLPARMEGFSSLALPLIEDCAMSIGAECGGRRVGAWGELSVCSFYATKMMSSGGEGGMVLTDAAELAKRIKELREYDGLPATRVRFNCKMTDMAAAMGRVQLRRLPGFVARRREIAGSYDRAFGEMPVECPPAVPEHVYYRYVIHVPGEAEDFAGRLEQQGVAARRPVFRPLHRELGEADVTCPHTATAYAGDISLPIYPSLSDAEVEKVVQAVQKVAGKENRGFR